MEVQSESKHVVDAVHSGDLEQLESWALALLLALINNGVIAAQHHGVSSSLVGLWWPWVQLPLARLHVWLIELLRDTREIRSEKLKHDDKLSGEMCLGSLLNTCRLRWDDDNEGGTNPLITMSISKTPSESTPLAMWVKRRSSPVWWDWKTERSGLIYKHKKSMLQLFRGNIVQV